MGKKVSFNHQANADGEHDVRAEISSVPEKEEKAPEVEKAPEPLKVAAGVAVPKVENAPDPLDLLAGIGKVFAGKSEDTLHKETKMNRIHIQLIQEYLEKQAKGKKVHLSDGNKEMLALVHKALKAKKLI